MSNLSLDVESSVALPHTETIAAALQEIQDLKDWIYDLERKVRRMREENRIAEIHAKGWFTLYDYTAQGYFRDTYNADIALRKEINAGHIERTGLALYRYVPQRSDSDWCADLPFAD